ncbi:hypothetical protein ERJ75_001124100 [Trypanosoma vivax]|nr:hypothetical protein ERJ75_001124100 [Trypanosoma vivax]
MTQRRGNARALCVAALCALWPLAAETAVKHALLQPKAKLLCDVSKALKAVAATAGKKDATIAALEGAATKHAGPLVRAAAAWHTCAASGAEKCSTLREKSATAARWHKQQTRPRRQRHSQGSCPRKHWGTQGASTTPSGFLRRTAAPRR